MDRRNFIKTAAVVGGSSLLIGPRAMGQTTTYLVRLDVPKQVIWGLGVEIQSDSIGSGNDGLPSAYLRTRLPTSTGSQNPNMVPRNRPPVARGLRTPVRRHSGAARASNPSAMVASLQPIASTAMRSRSSRQAFVITTSSP